VTAHYDSLLFVAFVNTPPKETAAELWQAQFGSLPAGFQQTPMAGSQATGQHEGMNVSIVVHPNRIDVSVGPTQQAPGEEQPAFDDKAAVLLGAGLITKIAASQDVQRPAVVFQRYEEVESFSQAIEGVVRRVPHLASPGRAIDIRYQVNVPRPSRTNSDIEIHRIGRWNSARRVLLRLDLGATATSTLATQTAAHVVQEYVDVFVDPSTTVPAGCFEAFLNEIIGEAADILSKGYDALA